MTPVFDENGMVTEPGSIRCFYFDPITNEYTGWSDEYIHVGVSMPGNSTDIDPGDEVAGMVAVFIDSSWEYQEDHRGKAVYSTTDGSSSVIDYIGAIRAGFTAIAPATPYDKWDGKVWVIDGAAQHADEVSVAEQKKAALMATAQVSIAPLQDAIDIGIATEEENAQLLAWKNYRVLLNRVDTSAAPSLKWPDKPEVASS
ncbi:TPA: tail fiber assembly protein [Escherichia coli]|nr:tail fiber assembly protein [Escherichia coli]HDW3222628.1 tail fiber assembly protein [Escherichia coli]HDW3995122.1 tail fiber assembly protein [Escherichia coli]